MGTVIARLLTWQILWMIRWLLAMLPHRRFEAMQGRLAGLWLDMKNIPVYSGGATDTGFGTVRVFDDFERKAIDTTNLYTGNNDAGGTAFAINEQRNGVVRGAVDTDDNDITNLFKDPVIWRPNSGGPLTFETRCTLITSIANGETFLGMTDDDGTDENPITLSAADVQTSNATNAVGFAYTGGGTVDWKAVSVNAGAAGTPTRCNAGGATTPVATTWQTFRVVINQDGDADFYIDGRWHYREDAATAPATSLCPGWALQSGGAARSLDIDYVYLSVGRV